MTEPKRAGVLGCLAAITLLATGVPVGAQTPTVPAPTRDVGTPAPVLSEGPSFSQLFKDTAGDFGRVRSRDTLGWLGTGVMASIVARTSDARVTRSLSGSDRLDQVFDSGRIIGGLPLQLGGALATYAVGRLTNSPRTTTVGADLFRAQALAQTMTFAVKLSARRTRPDGTTLSFPSGHTASAFASATVLQGHFGWKAGVPAYAVASYVAASRIQAKRHFLSDVAFGAALGVIAGRTVTIGPSRARFAVAPMAAPGGGGISFTLLPAH